MSGLQTKTRALVVWAAAIGVVIAAETLPTAAQKPDARSATAAATQPQDEEFAKLVKEWTTGPEFISPLVDHLPKSTTVPSPKDVLGHHIGEPKKLTYTTDIYNYYRTLAAKSPRVKVISIGKTDEGRDCLIVFIASEDTIKNLETYRGYLAQLADPRTLTEAQAKDVIAKAKPIYHLMGGLHSGETGPPEMLMELAYRLVVEDSPITNAVRNNLIVTITPTAEPDGRDRYVDWYYRHRVDVTDERYNLGPPYWGKYIFHDNNRDINYSQLTMKTLLDWYLQWHPPIMHELHESVPFMYTFSGQAPQNPTLDPILYGELPWFSNFEMSQMTKYGMPGVWTHGFVDMWSPGYLGFMASNHNGMLRMYETFGNGGATTMRRRLDSPGDGPPGRGSQTTREWYRPSPPYREVTWSMRNNTNYSQTGVLSALQLASEFPQVVLENFYRKSRNSIESGRKDPPHGFVIPAGQKDATRVALLVNLLRVQGIEVGKASAAINVKDGAFPAGSYIVKRDQPYGRLAKILLEKQTFPDPSLTTYDDTGWTMGLMLHTEVKEITDPAILTAAVESVSEVTVKGTVTGGAGSFIAVADHGSNSMLTLRYRLKDVQVQALEQPMKSGDVDLPAGSFVIATSQGGRDVATQARTTIEALGLTATTLSARPDRPMHDVDLPRVAIYSTWGNTQEVGWVRHAFDKFELPFDLIYKERVLKGDLHSAYDVIVVPNQGRSGKGLVFDIENRGTPIAYTKSDQYKTMGMYGESDDITGGMGLAGVLEFQKFVNDGGLLVTLGQASFFPPDLGLTRRIDASRTSGQFYAPGPIINAEIVRAEHPIFYGYSQKTIPVRWGSGPLLNVREEDRDQVLMRYPGGDANVISGLMRNANEIRNRPAIVDVPTGRGRVVLFAGNPCYRWQNHGEFGMLFNTVLHHNDVKPAARPAVTAGQ